MRRDDVVILIDKMAGTAVLARLIRMVGDHSRNVDHI